MAKQLWVILLTVILLQGVKTASGSEKINNKARGIEMARRMADSEMIHFPQAWTVDYRPQGAWNYTPGLIAYSMIRLWEVTGNIKYYDYAKSYADKYIDEDGNIREYRMEEYSTDRINSGKFLFDLNKKTGDDRYRKAIYLLREQMKGQPRTSEGGYWHKLVYTHQMWLDGLYMHGPFMVQFAKEFNEPEIYNKIISQFEIVNRHTYDPKTGLNYHGWDESKQQKWADPETGCSPHFWGRAMGWYAMALVDVLDFIPEDHPGRITIIDILSQVAKGIKKHQDKSSGLWYQVLDQGGKEGNYLESSASSMFTYALLKAARMKYISPGYKKVAIKAYAGILNQFIKENDNGTISLTGTCAVAGLGGNPYRNGSYEYYTGEPVRDNDPKGVGPFILAGIELSKR